MQALENLKPGGRLVINAVRKEETDRNYLVCVDFTNRMTNSIQARCEPMFPRRKHERYRLMGSALAIFERPRIFNLGKPRIIELGPLSDVSRGGLSVEYFADKKRFENFDELSILVPEHGITVYRIPFRKISELVIAKLNSKKIIMRRGIQFGDLNPHQVERLEKFIHVYAQEEAPDRRNRVERRTVHRSDDPDAAIPNQRHDRKKDRRKGRPTPEQREKKSSIQMQGRYSNRNPQRSQLPNESIISGSNK